jgi:predicted XRE-type DNA-binding protein
MNIKNFLDSTQCEKGQINDLIKHSQSLISSLMRKRIYILQLQLNPLLFNILSDYCERLRLKVEKTKTKVFKRSRRKKTEFKFHYRGEEIETVN